MASPKSSHNQLNLKSQNVNENLAHPLPLPADPLSDLSSEHGNIQTNLSPFSVKLNQYVRFQALQGRVCQIRQPLSGLPQDPTELTQNSKIKVNIELAAPFIGVSTRTGIILDHTVEHNLYVRFPNMPGKVCRIRQPLSGLPQDLTYSSHDCSIKI